MLTALTIQSHKGPYTVEFDPDGLSKLNADIPDNAHFIVDRRLAELYGGDSGGGGGGTTGQRAGIALGFAD